MSLTSFVASGKDCPWLKLNNSSHLVSRDDTDSRQSGGLGHKKCRATFSKLILYVYQACFAAVQSELAVWATVLISSSCLLISETLSFSFFTYSTRLFDTRICKSVDCRNFSSASRNERTACRNSLAC